MITQLFLIVGVIECHRNLSSPHDHAHNRSAGAHHSNTHPTHGIKQRGSSQDEGLAEANRRGAAPHGGGPGHGRYPGSVNDKHHRIGRHNNRDIMASAVGHSMAKNRYTPEEQKKYVDLGNAAVQGDKGAMNTLENDGIISYGERRALEEGAAGNIHNKQFAVNHNKAHHGGDNHRGYHPSGKHGDSHSLRHVNAEKKRLADEIASAHGNQAAQARVAARAIAHGDPHPGDQAISDAMRADNGTGGKLDPNTAAGGAYGKYGLGQAAKTGAEAGAAAGALAGAEAGKLNGLGPEAGARIGEEAGRKAGALAGDKYPGRPKEAGAIAGRAAGAMAAGLDYQGGPGGKGVPPPGAVPPGTAIADPASKYDQPYAAYKTPEEDANDAANIAGTNALAAGADPYTADAVAGMAGEDAGRKSAANQERLRRAIRDREELAKQADRERAENQGQRAHDNHSIANKAKALEAQKARHEADLKHRIAHNDPPHPAEVAKMQAYHDAANNDLLKDKAEAYLAEDRDKQKAELAQRMKEGDPAAADELHDIEQTENAAYGTLQGDPEAAEQFANQVAASAPSRNGMRELRPLGEAGDSETMAAVAAQAGNTAHKQNAENKANQAAEDERNDRAAAAEHRAALRAAHAGARGTRAADMLTEEQQKEDEDAANAAGLDAAQKAAADGAPPAVAAARGAKAKQHARAKLAAITHGATEEMAEHIGQQAANAVPSPEDQQPYENTLHNQEAQRREAYERTKAQAIRHGASPAAAEAAGQQAVADTAAAQAVANQAASQAATAGMIKREAAARAHAAAADAADAAEEEAEAATAAGVASAAANAPVAAARQRDAVEQAEAESEAAEEAYQMAKQARASNHKKLPLSDFIKRGEEKQRQAENQKEAEEAAKRHQQEMEEAEKREEARRRAPPVITGSELMAEQETEAAKGTEEALANAADEEEAQNAANLAYDNVKAMNGTDEQAMAEAAKAHDLKREEQEHSKALREKANRQMLKGQMSDEQAAEAARHMANAHAGKNPTGNSAEEVAANEAMARHARPASGGEEMEEEAMNSVVSAIPDDASSVPLKNVEIKLPMTCIPNVPAKNKEEENIKQTNMKLRDTLRNKVTDKEIPSGLGVIKGQEGYFNVPESAQKIGIKKGKVYYTPKAYEKMKQEGKDTSALKSKFSEPDKSPLPGQPAYYEADASGMGLGMDKGCGENMLSNGQEKLDISEASKIQIDEGHLEEEPWGKFSAKIRPQVYRGGSNGYEEETISEQKRREFEQRKRQENNRNKTSVEVFKSADGQDIAQITPAYGTRSQLNAEDAFNMIKNEEGSDAASAGGASEQHLNIAEAEGQGAALNKYMNSVHQEAEEYSELLNEANPLNGSTNSEISQFMSQSAASSSQSSVQKRDESSEENSLFNSILYNSKVISQQLGMPEEAFKKQLNSISSDAWTSFLEYYKRLAGNQKFNQLLAKMDSQPFFKEFKNTFPGIEPSTMYRMFSPSAQHSTHLPDMTTAKIVSITPITPVATIDDHNAPVIKQVVNRGSFNPTSPTTSYPSRPYSPNNANTNPREMKNIVDNFVPVMNAARDHLDTPKNNNNGDPFNNYTTNQATSPKQQPLSPNNWGFIGVPSNGASQKMGSPSNNMPFGPNDRNINLGKINEIAVQGQKYGPQHSLTTMVPKNNVVMNMAANRPAPIVPVIPGSANGARPMS